MTTPLTAATLTDDAIRELQHEAAERGFTRTVVMCMQARTLGGWRYRQRIAHLLNQRNAKP